jgi:hypothetical protein
MLQKDIDGQNKELLGDRGAYANASRSTSEGSSCSTPSSPRHVDLAGNQTYQGNEILASECPAHVTIRNTFLDTGVTRPLSLEEFYKERRIQSCPDDIHRELGIDEMDFRAAAQFYHTVGAMRASAEAAALVASQAAVAAMNYWIPSSSIETPNITSNTVIESPPPVISLSTLLEDPVLGSRQLPTVGSADHASGACKPCAFLYTRGCENGTNCNFCHLCPPGEKKRRQKEKYDMIRQAQSIGKMQL